MDKMTQEQRHRCMAANRSRDTRPELLVRRFLWHSGFRYRVNFKRLPGSPDIVLRRYKTVIFINGCFWHGHEDCNKYRAPKSNPEYWNTKVIKNRERDERVRNKLKEMGWRTVVIWECQLQKPLAQATLLELEHILNSFLIQDLSTKHLTINPYGSPETELNEIAIAAEPDTEYHSK